MSAVSHHERRQALRNVQRSIEELGQLEARLVEVVRNPPVRPGAPDGYPTGGDGVGGGSGTSDPVGVSVQQRVDSARTEVRRLTDVVWSELLVAERHLKEAVTNARRALATPDVSRIPARSRSLTPRFCVSCARPRPGTRNEACAFNARTTASKRSRADLCLWCLNRWEASSGEPARRKLPDIRLVVWKADNAGRHLTPEIEATLLGKTVAAS